MQDLVEDIAEDGGDFIHWSRRLLIGLGVGLLVGHVALQGLSAWGLVSLDLQSSKLNRVWTNSCYVDPCQSMVKRTWIRSGYKRTGRSITP